MTRIHTVNVNSNKICKRYTAQCQFPGQPEFTFAGVLSFGREAGEKDLRHKIAETLPSTVIIKKIEELEFNLPE